jgi:hypothetical protein
MIFLLLSPVRKYVLRMYYIRPSETFLTGSDVRHVTGRGPDRKYVMRMPRFFPCFFLSSSTVVPL